MPHHPAEVYSSSRPPPQAAPSVPPAPAPVAPRDEPSGADRDRPLTRVNGIGLWNSWTRNFKTPLLALLDLLDNSVDAAFVSLARDSANDAAMSMSGAPVPLGFRGTIHISADKTLPPRGSQGGGKSAAAAPGRITGIKIINNSLQPIKSLGRIMEVYSSSKGRVEHGSQGPDDEDEFADTIGENGVGLKQGCATLSNLSFVLSRNEGRWELAIIARQLQTEAGIYLPHFSFAASETRGLRKEMYAQFDRGDKITQCVTLYGEGSLEAGVERILMHVRDLSAPGSWGDHNSVFCVVLHELKHGHNLSSVVGQTDKVPSESGLPEIPLTAEMFGSSEADDQNSSTTLGDPMAARYSDRAFSILRQLRQELPNHYIHICPTSMDVRVSGERINFFYWQRRLVELTSFFIVIDPSHSYMDSPDWRDPINGYPLRVFCGFDAVRMGEKGISVGSMLIYSRKSGRLIKHEEDARAVLKLTSGGTHYSQGLTILVDDMNGSLPLNPTKQDVAFGEQANGDIHQRNLFSWLGAITSVYYQHQLDKCLGKKTVLTKKLMTYKIPVQDISDLKSLDAADFTYFRSIPWKISTASNIRVSSKNAIEVVPGRDTVRRIERTKPEPVRVHSATSSRDRKRAKTAISPPSALPSSSSPDTMASSNVHIRLSEEPANESTRQSRGRRSTPSYSQEVTPLNTVSEACVTQVYSDDSRDYEEDELFQDITVAVAEATRSSMPTPYADRCMARAADIRSEALPVQHGTVVQSTPYTDQYVVSAADIRSEGLPVQLETVVQSSAEKRGNSEVEAELRAQLKVLQQSVECQKTKSRERKIIIRCQIEEITKLKNVMREVEEVQVEKSLASSLSISQKNGIEEKEQKRPRELALEEQCYQLTKSLAIEKEEKNAQTKKLESDLKTEINRATCLVNSHRTIEQKVALIKHENTRLEDENTRLTAMVNTLTAELQQVPA